MSTKGEHENPVPAVPAVPAVRTTTRKLAGHVRKQKIATKMHLLEELGSSQDTSGL